MLRFWKIEFAAALSAAVICLASGAQATTVNWTGNDAFNNSGNSITFTGFTSSQLTSISGEGTYEASRSSTFPFNAVSTTFNLLIDLNGIWTSILTWTSSDSSEQNLSDLSTPIHFASGTVTGLELTVNPAGTSDDPTFDNFDFFHRDDLNQEQFTFNNVTTTPLPAALPLFAGGLGLVGMFARRRKQKASAIAAA